MKHLLPCSLLDVLRFVQLARIHHTYTYDPYVEADDWNCSLPAAHGTKCYGPCLDGVPGNITATCVDGWFETDEFCNDGSQGAGEVHVSPTQCLAI